MNLGIEDRRALVCASSRGLGYACAVSLAREGASVIINGRDAGTLAAAAAAIESATGRSVTPLVGDLMHESQRNLLINACGAVDILVNNNAGPAPGDFLDYGREDWLNALEAHMLSAVHLMTALVPGMRDRRFGRIVNITSAMVKAPSENMALSTSARIALTAASKALSRQVAADNVTINNLLPERIDTDRQRYMAERMMKEEGIDMEEARRRIVAALPAKRFGKPSEFGDACAFLCSEQAGFITGQNFQLDGGSYRGVL